MPSAVDSAPSATRRTAYGVWQRDLVLLLPSLLAVAVKLAERPAPAAMADDRQRDRGAMMVHYTPAEWYVWFAPSPLLGCVVVPRLASRPQPASIPTPSLEPAAV